MAHLLVWLMDLMVRGTRSHGVRTLVRHSAAGLHMRLGVTDRSRTGTSGFTTHGSAIELRTPPSARLKLVSVAGLEPSSAPPPADDPRDPKSRALPAAPHRAEMGTPHGWGLPREKRSGLEDPMARYARPSARCFATSWPACRPERTDGGLRLRLCRPPPSTTWLRRDVWRRTTESNREPSALEAAALPIELDRQCWYLVHDSNVRPPAS